jgi:cysteinyl-tRNA synthetase
MTLHLYNTLTRDISPFTPLSPGKVGIYLCGATVQAPPHIGHIRSGINFDILRRWLLTSGYEVTLIRNVTDIDDKILHNAIHEEMPWWALAQKYERVFTAAYAELNVLPPTYEPRATGHITQMIELISLLIERGKAYSVANGDVYLDVRALDSYLTLSGQKLDDLQSSADGEESIKRNPQDFALWKSAKPGEPSWPTPWGDGRPGWHIECSAMAQAYLGAKFDIHAGGLDLIFPHHENEIAQSNGAGYPFAQRWLHNAWVTTAGEKMSKSLGNTLRIHELLKRVRGIELRWYLGSAHYRSMLEYSPEALDESAINFRRIESFLKRAASQLGKVPETFISDEFANAMNDDLAVPAALAVISELVKEGNNALAAKDSKILEVSSAQVRGALAVLGCDPWDDTWAKNDAGLEDVLSGLMKTLLQEREEARARKDFASADRIRDRITELGLTLEDTPDGPRWSR